MLPLAKCVSTSTLVRAKIGFPSAGVRTNIIATLMFEIVVTKLPNCYISKSNI